MLSATQKVTFWPEERIIFPFYFILFFYVILILLYWGFIFRQRSLLPFFPCESFTMWDNFETKKIPQAISSWRDKDILDLITNNCNNWGKFKIKWWIKLLLIWREIKREANYWLVFNFEYGMHCLMWSYGYKLLWLQ